MMGLSLTSMAYSQSAVIARNNRLKCKSELQSYPETSSYIQQIFKKNQGVEPQLSSLLHAFTQDQQRSPNLNHSPIIEELRFLLSFYSRKKMHHIVD